MGFANLTLLVFLGGSSFLKVVGVVSACAKVLYDCKTNHFEVDPLIEITSITFRSHQVLAFAGTRRGTEFEYEFDFLSFFRYFTWFFVMTTTEVSRIVFNIRFDRTHVEGFVNERKSTVHWQVDCIVFPLPVDMLDAERSDPSRFEFPTCVQKVDVLY